MGRPKCMTELEHTRWQFWNDRIMSQHEMAYSPCEDCPASFAVEMRASDRCDGIPGKAERRDGLRRIPLAGEDMTHVPTMAELAAQGITGNRAASRIAVATRTRERDERAQVVLQLYDEVGNQSEVARRLGIAPSTVSKYVLLRKREMLTA